MNKESFVLYESVYKQFERLCNRGRNEDALEFIKAIMEFGLYGVVPDEDSDVWLFGFEQSATSIAAAKDRYAAAIENGKKGGRPKKVSDDEIANLKEQGLTNKQVAEKLNCSVSTVEKANAKNRKNQKNLNENVNENVNKNDNASDKLLYVGVDLAALRNASSLEEQAQLLGF